VSSLQERLEGLQVTMLDVMNKYGSLRKLEVCVIEPAHAPTYFGPFEVDRGI
jgi:hypothetical protein